MTWFLSTKVGRWVAMIGGALALLAGAVLLGWSKRGQAEAGKVLKEYQKTRRRMDEVDTGTEYDDALEWLRERDKR